MKVNELLNVLIKRAKDFGLNSQDIYHSKEFLLHNEPELCLDQVATQLYEFDLKIDIELYNLIIEISNKLKIDIEKYSFMRELVNTESI